MAVKTRVASRQTPLPVMTPVEVVASDPGAAEKRQEKAELARIDAREAARKSADKIGQVEGIDHEEFERDRSPSQVFGAQVIEHCGGTDKIPPYRFSRWYWRSKIIVDTFATESKYNAADVDGRRAMAKKYGVRYAALGPRHSRYPYQQEDMRRKFPSLVEQLELE